MSGERTKLINQILKGDESETEAAFLESLTLKELKEMTDHALIDDVLIEGDIEDDDDHDNYLN